MILMIPIHSCHKETQLFTGMLDDGSVFYTLVVRIKDRNGECEWVAWEQDMDGTESCICFFLVERRWWDQNV